MRSSITCDIWCSKLTCASGEVEALLKDQTDQPDVQMKEPVKSDNQSEEQQASGGVIGDGVKVSKKQLCEQQTVQLMKEVRRSVSSVSAKAKHGVNWVLLPNSWNKRRRNYRDFSC